MISTDLNSVADLVVREAQRRGYVAPRHIRSVVVGEGVDETLWREVLALAMPSLAYRKGRYYYAPPVSERVREAKSRQHDIQQSVRALVQAYRDAASRIERREEERIDFVQPVKVRTEDERECTFVTRDVSTTGIRLIGTRRFLGQKLFVTIPSADGSTSWEFTVRILWTCAIGEDLVENGGSFLDVRRALSNGLFHEAPLR